MASIVMLCPFLIEVEGKIEAEEVIEVEEEIKDRKSKNDIPFFYAWLFSWTAWRNGVYHDSLVCHAICIL